MASYPDNWVDDGNIWCYYNVTTTESATTLGANTNRASAMWVDGEPVTPANSYTFDTIGEHLVKFTPAQWGRYYFSGSKALVRCYLPTSITYIDDNSFSGCENLTLLNFNSLSITRLGQQAFMNCSNLVMDNLSLPLLDTLGSSALAGCRKLTSIANLGSITSIGAYSFNGCTSLASIVLPATLTSLGNYLFPNSLKTVTSLAETPPTLGSGVFSRAPTAIYVLPSSVQAYKEAAGWSSYANKIYPLWEEKPININHLSLGDFRRRIMLGISRPKASLYPPDYVDDGKIWAYISVPEAGTYRISDGYLGNWFNDAELDGVSFGNNNRDQSLPQGEHIIKYTLKNTAAYPAWSRGLSSIFTLIIMPSTITQIDGYSFYGATGAVAKVLMDKSKIVSIGDGCFWHSMVDIGNVDFPVLQSLTNSFNDYSRAGQCIQKNLGVITTITSQAFRGTVFKDKTYRIPATVTSIADLAFYNNNNSLIYYLYPPTPPTLGGSQVFFRAPAAIYVPVESVQAYKEAAGWSSYANKIQAIPE